MRALAWRRLAIVTALAGTAACTAIAGLDGEFTTDATTTLADDSGTDGAQTPHDGQVFTDSPATVDDAGQDGTAPHADAAVADTGADVDTYDYDAGAFLPDPHTCPNVDENHYLFCWNYDSSGGQSKFGADQIVGAKASIVQTAYGDAGDAEQAVITTNAGVAMVWADFIPPTFAKNHTISLTFDFQVHTAEREAIIGGIAWNNHVVGVSILPTGCDGGPCLAENRLVTTAASHDAPADHARATKLDLDRWYHATVEVTWLKPGWASKVTVSNETSGQILAVRSGGALPETAGFDAGALYQVMSGAFNGETVSGTTVTIVDNLLVEWIK